MSNYSDDQTQPADSLDDRGVDDVLDEGISPPERPFHRDGSTLEDRLAQEEPEDVADLDEGEPGDEDGPPGPEVGDERSGRLVAPDEGAHEDGEKDLVAEDVGIDGGAASAEEAAVHVAEDAGVEAATEDEEISEPPDE